MNKQQSKQWIIVFTIQEYFKVKISIPLKWREIPWQYSLVIFKRKSHILKDILERTEYKLSSSFLLIIDFKHQSLSIVSKSNIIITFISSSSNKKIGNHLITIMLSDLKKHPSSLFGDIRLKRCCLYGLISYTFMKSKKHRN